MQGKFIENFKPLKVSVAKTYASTAATAEWINMKNCEKVTFLIQTGAWAGGTAAVTLKQATSDGGSSAAVSFTKYWYINPLYPDTITEATASSNSFNLSAASTMYIVEVKADQLNVTSGYDWVKIAVASPGANADYYSITAVATNLKYGPDSTLLS